MPSSSLRRAALGRVLPWLVSVPRAVRGRDLGAVPAPVSPAASARFSIHPFRPTGNCRLSTSCTSMPSGLPCRRVSRPSTDTREISRRDGGISGTIGYSTSPRAPACAMPSRNGARPTASIERGFAGSGRLEQCRFRPDNQFSDWVVPRTLAVFSTGPSQSEPRFVDWKMDKPACGLAERFD